MSADLTIPAVIWVVVGTDGQNHYSMASTDKENATSFAQIESMHPGQLRAVRYRRDIEAQEGDA